MEFVDINSAVLLSCLIFQSFNDWVDFGVYLTVLPFASYIFIEKN